MAKKNLKELVNKHLKQNQNFLLDPNFRQMHSTIMEEVEKTLIEFALNKTDFSKTNAAQLLGISRSTLARKIELYQIRFSPKKN